MSSTFAGNSDGLVTGLCPAPPPPPPPPPVAGQVPAMRINTVEPPVSMKRPQTMSEYEPPTAIQNAMLTKDKKPFTYTPGMGGKLDLSQIRSPRMARRVAKNANDEGIEGPPKSALEPKPTQNTASVFIQPQVAVPVFPTNVQPQLPNRNSQTPINRVPSNVSERQQEPKNMAKVETKASPVTPIQPSSPESSSSSTPTTPTQVTLAKAPTPWLQNKNKPPEELPEWAKRASKTPESPTSPQQQPPQWQQQKPGQTQQWQPQLQKPIPQQQQQQSPPVQQWQNQQTPIQILQSPPAQQWQNQQKPIQIQQSPPVQQWQNQPKPPFQQQQQQQQPQFYQRQQSQPFQKRQPVSPTTPPVQANLGERMIPIRIEDRPSVFDVKPEVGHHQFKQPSSHHQQRWGQGHPNQVSSQSINVQPVSSAPAPQQSGGAFIIPIMMDSGEKKPVSGGPYLQPVGNNVAENQAPKVVRTIPIQQEDKRPVSGPPGSFSQANVRNNVIENQAPKVMQRGPPTPTQYEPGPVQSRSFRVLQKITDTDSNEVDAEQIRKLQLSEDDRILMNKFKEQVDSDNYLHQEEDPRYRGAAIPSRAFRFLQNMTESGDAPVATTTPRMQNAALKKQNRNSKSFEETQANLPPSEQQVPEPKKYMGSAIPSRSFRILQAMTAPESVGPDATDY